ncbi:hypothetical protein FRC12_011019 [Ceratobasidium sp. 428]|nr:hypothetical protein FRC12_011019 [Ceratobasidium sp. 428]
MLRTQTSILGRRLRRFQSEVAVHYNTVETDNEHEKQKRKETRRALAVGSVAQSTESHKRAIKLNLTTFKLHSLGDYPDAIELFGTTDGYSTQIGEREHCRAKSHAKRASQAQLVEGVNKADRREKYMSRCAENQAKFEDEESIEKDSEGAQDDAHISGQSTLYEDLEANNLLEHHHIGTRGTTVHFNSFLRQNANDRALINFLPSLKDHLLMRFGVSPAENTLYTELQRQQVVIPSGTFVKHSTIRVTNTTYDVRRAQDTINPQTNHHFIMVQSRDDNPDHPFWYAKVIGIYHANVMHLSLQSQAPRVLTSCGCAGLNLLKLGAGTCAGSNESLMRLQTRLSTSLVFLIL